MVWGRAPERHSAKSIKKTMLAQNLAAIAGEGLILVQESVRKDAVRNWWNLESCGEAYAVGAHEAQRLRTQEAARYTLEPYIFDHAKFNEGKDKDVLEVGVGMGADHLQWARARPRSLTGVDLTPRAIEITSRRFRLEGFPSDLRVADAESLPFPDASFDIVYSWGVIHHSPDTPRAFAEIARVLRPGAVARIMIYQDRSITGFMLWLRYSLLRGRPAVSLKQVCAEYLQGPGEKTYTPGEARAMVLGAGFADCRMSVQLCHGDLLQGEVGARHTGPLLRIARALWPRRIIIRFLARYGLYLVIEARR
ncbi:MAG: class I SAM-dependent methyltransferase [Beijerinckiaceae bacterium]|nr:class I SAM-dependent methyltransferase [Beijerinckiaceae bacterium]